MGAVKPLRPDADHPGERRAVRRGFINPYTVPSAAFWKLAQSKPNDTYRFHLVSVTEAQAARRAIDALCTESSLEDAG